MFENTHQSNRLWTYSMTERRKYLDRRHFGIKHNRSAKCDRRSAPDRRLNSISAEWVPINHVNIHPVTRLVFSKS